MPDIEYEEFEVERQAPFFSFPLDDAWYKITLKEQLPDSPKFKLGDKPAKVWLIEENGDEYRLTLTSSRLVELLDWYKAKVGNIIGVPLDIKPVKGATPKDRTFRGRIPKSAQVKLDG